MIKKLIFYGIASLVIGCMALRPAFGQTLVRDAEIEELLNNYGTPLFKAADLNPHNVRFFIVGDKSINAAVSGGQNIFVNTGLILESETPNELKGVLAHETGHISGAHLARLQEGQRKAIGVILLSVALGLAAVAAGEGGAGAAIIGSAPYYGTLAFFTYTRTQEASADQAGADFLEATGQSGRGLLAFFDRFRYQEVFSKARQTQYFRSHPLSSDRMAALRKKVESSPFFNKEDSEEDKYALNMVKAKIEGFLNSPQHVFQKYPPDTTKDTALYARSAAYLQTGERQRALKDINMLIARHPRNPYFHELKGQIYFETGQAKKAVSSYAEAVNLRPDSPLLHLGLAQALLSADMKTNAREALDHLKITLTSEPSNTLAWGQSAKAHEALGQRALAQLAIAEQAFTAYDMERAFIFASRARDNLENNTSEQQRALDIIAISKAQIKTRKRTRGSHRLNMFHSSLTSEHP